MIEAIDDPLVNQPVESVKVTRFLRRSALDRDQYNIIMPMTIWIITFSEGSPILFGREEVRVKPVCGAKTIPSCHIYL